MLFSFTLEKILDCSRRQDVIAGGAEHERFAPADEPRALLAWGQGYRQTLDGHPQDIARLDGQFLANRFGQHNAPRLVNRHQNIAHTNIKYHYHHNMAMSILLTGVTF